MKKIIALAFILFGLGLGYVGYTKMEKSNKPIIEIGKLEIKAQNTDSKTEAYLFIGGGILSILVGLGYGSKSFKK